MGRAAQPVPTFGATSPLAPVYPILNDPMSGAANVMEYNVMIPYWSPYALQNFWFSQEGYLYPPYTMPGSGVSQLGDFAALGVTNYLGLTGVNFPGSANPLNGGCPGSNGFAYSGQTFVNPFQGGAQGNRIRAIGVGEVVSEIRAQPDSLGYAFFNYSDLAALGGNAQYGYLTYGEWAGGINGTLIPTDPINPSGHYGAGYSSGNITFPGNGQLPTCSGPCTLPPNSSFPNVRNGAYMQWSVLRAIGDANNAANLANLNTLTTDIANGVNSTVPDFIPFNATADGDNGIQFYRSHFSPAGVNYNAGNTPNNGISGANGQTIPNTEAGGDVGGCLGWRYAPNGPTNVLNCRY